MDNKATKMELPKPFGSEKIMRKPDMWDTELQDLIYTDKYRLCFGLIVSVS